MKKDKDGKEPSFFEDDEEKKELDAAVNPDHYKIHPSGVECITVTEHFNLNLGSAIGYIWRSDHKDTPIENLSKAVWHLQREIKRLEVIGG